MRRASQWRPWQFSLRFLLLLTSVIAVTLGWLGRQIAQQQQAAKELRSLGGSVDFGDGGPRWLAQISCGDSLQRIERVEIPGPRVEEAMPTLKAIASLRKLTMVYWRVEEPRERVVAYVGNGYLMRGREMHDCVRCVQAELPCVEVEVSETPPPNDDWWFLDFKDPARVNVITGRQRLQQLTLED